MSQEPKNFKASIFFKWFVNNKMVTALAIILLLLLNILLINKVNFIFQPVGEFLTTVSLPVVLAAVFYYLLNPIVDFLEKRKIPRLATIIILFIVIAGLIIWGLAVVIPNITNSTEIFAKRVPYYVTQIQDQVNDTLSNQRFEQFRPQMDKLMQSLGNNLIDWSKNFSATAVNSLTDIISKTANVLISLVVFPFVLFYLLRDGQNLNHFITRLLPPAWRKDSSKILTEMNNQLSNYVRGQVIVAFAVVILFCIGLPIIGLRYAITLAILSGFFNLIPFLGFYLALIPALTIGLATGGPIMMIKVLVVFIIEQTIEGRLISPLVLGSQLDMHPITVLFVLLTGAKIFGLWGVLLAIPFYTVVKVVVVHTYHWYKDISDIYNEELLEEEKEQS